MCTFLLSIVIVLTSVLLPGSKENMDIEGSVYNLGDRGSAILAEGSTGRIYRILHIERQYMTKKQNWKTFVCFLWS